MARVLIVDDDPQILKLLEAYLRKAGHETATAGNGNQAKPLLAAEEFDLLLTDIVMPEEDGLGLLLWLRNQTYQPKVIAISGGSPRLDQNMLLDIARYSAHKVLTKPVDYETLMAAVKEVLEA